MLGLESAVPEGWGKTFATGGEPSSDASAYPSKEEILDALKAQIGRDIEESRRILSSASGPADSGQGL